MMTPIQDVGAAGSLGDFPQTEEFRHHELAAPWLIAAFETEDAIGWISDRDVAVAHIRCCSNPVNSVKRRYFVIAGRKLGTFGERAFAPGQHWRIDGGYVTHGEYNMTTDDKAQALRTLQAYQELLRGKEVSVSTDTAME